MPSRKIPKEEFIYQVIRSVLRKRKMVESQEELCFLVLKELEKYDKKFVLTPQRVRSIAIKIPGIKVKAKTKQSPKMKVLKKCPVCKRRITKIYGKNLLNKRIHIGYLCKRCGYSSDLGNYMPMKYIFMWKKS